jgi:hypothetical protein
MFKIEVVKVKLQLRLTALSPSILMVPEVRKPSITSVGCSWNVNAVILTYISLLY